jgi:multidrug transporter EmrE-like cation transporter
MIETWAIGLVLLSTVLSALGPILFKKASGKFNLNPLEQLKNKYLLAGIAMYLMGMFAFVPALRGGPLSVLYPILSIKYIWVCLLSVKLLDEQMSRIKWAGIFLIILGISLIGSG